MSHDAPLRVGLVSISDRASSGVYEDKGLPGLRDWFAAAVKSPWLWLLQGKIAGEIHRAHSALTQAVAHVVGAEFLAQN